MKSSSSSVWVQIHTYMHVHLHAHWRAFPWMLVCQHLPVYTVAYPDGKFPWGEKSIVQSSSSDFTLMMLFVWWSLLGVRRLRRTYSARIKEPQGKIDKGGCLKDEQGGWGVGRKGACSIRECINEDVRNKCERDRGRREEKEINERVWRAKERRTVGGSGLSLTTLSWGDHSSLWTVCMYVCICVVSTLAACRMRDHKGQRFVRLGV